MEDKRTECGADNAGPAAACGPQLEGWKSGGDMPGGPVNFNILENIRTTRASSDELEV